MAISRESDWRAFEAVTAVLDVAAATLHSMLIS